MIFWLLPGFLIHSKRPKGSRKLFWGQKSASEYFRGAMDIRARSIFRPTLFHLKADLELPRFCHRGTQRHTDMRRLTSGRPGQISPIVPFGQIENKSLNLGLRRGEIDEQADTYSSRFQIIQ